MSEKDKCQEGEWGGWSYRYEYQEIPYQPMSLEDLAPDKCLTAIRVYRRQDDEI